MRPRPITSAAVRSAVKATTDSSVASEGGAAAPLDWESALLNKFLVGALLNTTMIDSVGDQTKSPASSVSWRAPGGGGHATNNSLQFTASTSRYSAGGGQLSVPSLAMTYAFRFWSPGVANDIMGNTVGSRFGITAAATTRNVTINSNGQSATFNAAMPNDSTTWHTVAFFAVDGSIRMSVDGVEQSPAATDYVGTAGVGYNYMIGGTAGSLKAYLGDLFFLDGSVDQAWEKLLLAEADIATRWVG